MSTATSSDSTDATGSSTWAIEPRSFVSRHFELYQGDELVVTLQMAFWREGCTFTIAGHEFTIRRMSIWTDGFELVAGEDVVCSVRRKFWSRRFELTAAHQLLNLQPAGFFLSSYELLDRERRVGHIGRSGWFTRRREASFDTTVPPPIQVLAIFLVLIVAARQSKSHGAH